jgi:murein DD-endopeptidase MepM/ murein hydrolase activator NlpD
MVGRIVVAVLLAALCGCDGAAGSDQPKPTEPSTTTSAGPTSTTAAATTTQPARTTLLPAPNGVNPDSPCLLRAEFDDPADSLYVLPWAAGGEYYLSQSYCFSEGGHRLQLAYDFDLPVGTDVLAARDGVVKSVKQDSPDDGQGYGEHNYVFIQHDDGSVAFYAHLMQDGVRVEVGDEIAVGDVIAQAGNSGLTGHPHLHFGVYQSWPPEEERDMPVNFRNAAGQHDSRGGLVSWRLYEALP